MRFVRGDDVVQNVVVVVRRVGELAQVLEGLRGVLRAGFERDGCTSSATPSIAKYGEADAPPVLAVLGHVLVLAAQRRESCAYVLHLLQRTVAHHLAPFGQLEGREREVALKTIPEGPYSFYNGDACPAEAVLFVEATEPLQLAVSESDIALELGTFGGRHAFRAQPFEVIYYLQHLFPAAPGYQLEPLTEVAASSVSDTCFGISSMEATRLGAHVNPARVRAAVLALIGVYLGLGAPAREHELRPARRGALLLEAVPRGLRKCAPVADVDLSKK